MKTKTYLSGKDAALEDTIEKATILLKELELEIAAVSWMNPAPHCWSVHLQETSCPHLFTNGKGTSKLASLASGYGEFFERLSTNFFFADYLLEDNNRSSTYLFYPDELHFSLCKDGSVPHRNQQGTELLNDTLRSFYNPEGTLEGAHLADHNANRDNHSICALPFHSLLSGKTTYFPVSLLDTLYGSNGMAAGNSPEECCSQALSEIIERYVKNEIISRGISLPEVPAAYCSKYPKVRAILDTLNRQGFSVKLKDASLGGRFPVISALLADRESGGVFAAFGASCRFETAIERTLTELLQGRSAERLREFYPPCHDISLAADPHNLESHFIDSDGLLSWRMFADKEDFSFCPWDFTGSSSGEFLHLQQILSRSDFEIYRAEYCHAGMYCCRMVIPGMSEIYPIEDLQWNNRNSGAVLRPYLLKLDRMDSAELGHFLNLLEAQNFNDQYLVSDAIGVLFEEDSAWATLRFGELKALILLAIGDRQAAIDWCSWSLHHGQLNKQRRRFFRLLHTLLNFAIRGERAADYSQSLRFFYREDEIRTAEAVACGRLSFPGLHFGRSWTDISREHLNLLKIYQRLDTFKSTWYHGDDCRQETT
ncbi:MAG: YcaO-like family protein [Desulforhopalus sp.]